MSLRRRVIVGFLAVAAVLVVTNLLLSSTYQSFLLSRVDRQLVSAASPLSGRRLERLPRPVPPPPGGIGGQQAEAFSEYYIAHVNPITGSVNRVSSALGDGDRSPPALDVAAATARSTHPSESAEPFTVHGQSGSGSGSWRLVAIHSRGGGGIVVVGISLHDLNATLNRIRMLQIAGTAAVLIALGVVSWWMIGLGVHPLHDMAKTADAIAGGDLSRRVHHPDERTEAGRLGAALNSMLERIEEAFRSREASEARVRRFAADASHELRTPLTSIQGYAELWRAGGLRSKTELAEAMRRIEEEGRRMAALVEDLLLLARLDQHRPLDDKPVRLDQIVADGVRDARAVEPDRPIELSVVPVTVRGDEMRLREVVANLLANVRLHTPAEAAAHVSVRPIGGRARLEIADDGPGMPPEVAAKVFERFFRADPSRARSGGGAGLGLAIVAAIAEAHGGHAGVESEPGRGTRFVVDLPMTAPATRAEDSTGVAAGG